MSWYTPEQKRESVARAHAILAETAPAVERTVARSAGSPLVYKTHQRREDDSLPAGVHILRPQCPGEILVPKTLVGVGRGECICRRLKAFAEEAGKGMAEFVGRKLDPLERELKLLRHEFIVLREDVALARALHDLRSEVARRASRCQRCQRSNRGWRAEATLAAGAVRKLQRELDVTKDKLGKLRSINRSRITTCAKCARRRRRPRRQHR